MCNENIINGKINVLKIYEKLNSKKSVEENQQK